MIALSIVSVAIMLERAWFFVSASENVERLARLVSERLEQNDLSGAYETVASSRSAEAAVVAAGLRQADRGPDAAEEAMAGATALQRLRLERRLAFLGTLGNNAPFVGLLGTVIGIVQAFDKLQTAGMGGAGAGAEVMGAIAEALVATAIGLGVAIPAVAAFNYFQRRIKSTLGNAEALRHIVLAYLKARRVPASSLPLGPSTSAARDEEPSQPFRIERARTVTG
jgi:biopolymer transport protein ExbB